jgi:hypothetical protein
MADQVSWYQPTQGVLSVLSLWAVITRQLVGTPDSHSSLEEVRWERRLQSEYSVLRTVLKG